MTMLPPAAVRALRFAAAFIADERNFTDDQILFDGCAPYDHADLLAWASTQVGATDMIPVVMAAHGWLPDARGQYRHFRRTRSPLRLPPPGTDAARAFRIAKEVEARVACENARRAQ